MVDNYSEIKVEEIAKELAPIVMNMVRNQPTYWGDESRVHVGKEVNLVNTLFNVVCGDVYIGDYAFFGHNVCVLTGTHTISSYGKDRQIGVPSDGRDIYIGKGVWIASNATVLGPCNIGENAVIGVGSVVMGDVKPGWFYAGIPARPIKPVGPEYDRKVHVGVRRLVKFKQRSVDYLTGLLKRGSELVR